MTQGGALGMVSYGISILSLIKNLKSEFPDVTQPWCADNVGALDIFVRVKNDMAQAEGITLNPL